MVVIKETSGMFWGVTLETAKRYSQTVARSFHISMATVEPKSIGGGGDAGKNVSVMIHHDRTDFMICTLSQGRVLQQALDLNFAEGEEIVLYLVGDGTVHLTGYLMADDFDEPSRLDSTEYDSDEISDEDDDDISDDEMAPELSTTFGELETTQSTDEEDEDWEETRKRKAKALEKKAKKSKTDSSLNMTGDSWTDDYSMEMEEDDDDDDDDEDSSEDYSDDETPFSTPAGATKNGSKGSGKKHKKPQQKPAAVVEDRAKDKLSKSLPIMPTSSSSSKKAGKGDKNKKSDVSMTKKPKSEGSTTPVVVKTEAKQATPKIQAKGSSPDKSKVGTPSSNTQSPVEGASSKKKRRKNKKKKSGEKSMTPGQ